MLISSHRLDEVASLVNRVVEMDQGRVVLDDEVADLVDISSQLSCRIRMLQHEDAFAKALSGWSFQADKDDKRVWHGLIAGPDRLRFLGMLSRYAALLSGIENDKRIYCPVGVWLKNILGFIITTRVSAWMNQYLKIGSTNSEAPASF